jgi:AraC-like DNA-binding protein
MSAAPWSGALAIGVGWAALDARLGKNTAHAHLADQVILGLDGAVIVTTTSVMTAPKGKAVLIPAGQTHSIGPEGRLTRSVYVDPRFSGIRNDQKRDRPAFLRDDLSAALHDITDINQARDWARQFVGRLPGSAIDQRLQKALGNVRALASPAALARELALSPSRLREIVKADFGVPPSKLLQWLQLLGAAKAMEASSSLADAAAAGGFADQAHFTRRLQQWFGVTPKIGLSGLEVSVDDLS